MIGRRSTALAIASLFIAPAAIAQAASPQAFLDAIYRPYLDKKFKGNPYDKTDRYFASPLREAIDKDYAAAKTRGEVPTLDGDPFIDAQDWEITNLKVDAWVTGPTNAVGVALFDNFGKPQRVALDLVLTPAGWRITDIKSPSGSLRTVFKVK